MGTCVACSNSLLEDVFYADDIQINIKERDRLGKVFRSEKVKFKLNLPVFTETKSYSNQMLNLNVSSCLLSSIDPRGLINKECQDNILIVSKNSIFLACVFDGHGTEGQKVVESVKAYIKSYFLSNSQAFQAAPHETISFIITECDKNLRLPSSSIDCSLSGCTAIILVITDVVHIGSVGDSKAVLAMIGSPDQSFKPTKRIVDPGKSLFPLKLAVEQRPNMREELERIKKAGGKVQQLTNEQGIKIGPYRVWKKIGTLPGLAMSRSIGDSIGKTIGIISNPICNSFMLDKNSDLFVVIATDGIWDVMHSNEVINFVEKFRKVCGKNKESVGFPIKVMNI